MSTMQELLNKVAAENGTVISKDDPIMILHTMHQQWQVDLKKDLENVADGIKVKINEAADEWERRSSANAQNILNQTISASKNVAKGIIDGVTSDVHAGSRHGAVTPCLWLNNGWVLVGIVAAIFLAGFAAGQII